MPRNFFIRESELDIYQQQVLSKRIDLPMVVKGCAGSGKSILALHRVKQAQEQSIGSYYFILFTKTLKQYMQDGIDSLKLDHNRVTYFWHWKNELNAPSADYIFIDEAQDFSEEDILLFQSKARKSLIFFGDSAQQIYSFRTPPPISMEQIAAITGLRSKDLMFNHRLPKKIARFAQCITNPSEDLEGDCLIEGNELPYVLRENSLEEQFDKIIEIIENRQFDDVGILFRKNKEIEYAKSYFSRNGLPIERKENRNMDLDFSNSLPKLTTYHSSKGLQFEAVFIPNCNVDDEDSRNPLYVAATRTYQSLFVFHSGNLSPFISSISPDLYQTSLISRTGRRL